MNIISFVVDGLALHYYQAELLLFSLRHFAKQPIENIIVQCTPRVDAIFLNYLQKNNYHYTIIEPFLDGKYCNKIRQLDAFRDLKQGNIILLDTDTFVLEPLNIPNTEVFSAKTVDMEKPPLAVIKKIFHYANISLPKTINTDWSLNNGLTLATNFNGGFYYIPNHAINIIANAWKKWATWLFESPELFENNHQRINTDQISMALAISSCNIDYQIIASNYNCPIHRSETQQLFDKNIPIMLLHYHQEINSFGLLNTKNASNLQIKTAIDTANSAIATHRYFEFYSIYRKSLIKPIVQTDNTEKLRLFFESFKEKQTGKLKLILHAGTPKTGTTSIQLFLASHQTDLRNQGYLYPNNYGNTGEPKHQWLVSGLIKNNVDILINELYKIKLQLNNDIHTIILSAEGIYNHWFDFNQEAKSFLAMMAKYLKLELWLWFREPLDFINSLYCQNLKNPKVPAFNCYGQDWSLEQMLADEWFSNHLDYIGFVYEIEALFGKKNLHIFQYQHNMIALWCRQLKLIIDNNQQENDKENITFSRATMELLCIINQYPISLFEKNKLLQNLTEIDAILSLYEQPEISKKSLQYINENSALGLGILNYDYKINLMT